MHRLAPERFVGSLLESLRTLMSDESLEAVHQTLTKAGRYALTVAAVLVPLAALGLHVKWYSEEHDSAFLTYGQHSAFLMYGAVGFVVVVVAQYMAYRLLGAIVRLVHADPSRMSSTSFLDCMALFHVVAGVACLVVFGYPTFQLMKYRGFTPDCLVPLSCAVGALLINLYYTMLCLHPKFLNIIPGTDISADLEAAGILAFDFKASVQWIRMLFGLGTVLGTIVLVPAVLAALSDEPAAQP